VIEIPDAYLVQAAMPVGINTLVVAHAYDRDRSGSRARLRGDLMHSVTNVRPLS
jgi:hypothetical protein